MNFFFFSYRSINEARTPEHSLFFKQMDEDRPHPGGVSSALSWGSTGRCVLIVLSSRGPRGSHGSIPLTIRSR